MTRFKVQIDSAAKSDIQDGISWYNSKVPGLGKEFHLEVKIGIASIQKIGFFQVRYDEIRFLPMKRFP
jgi:hypothetical protein